MTRETLSKQTRNNWLIDAAVAAGALIAAISGIYFLLFPSGGYQGGRNPYYGILILFDRHTWEDLHTWFGVLMIAAAVVHFSIHWNWVKSMAKRIAKSAAGSGVRMSRNGVFNVAIDLTVALSFLLAAASGVYFLFAGGGHAVGPVFIFNRAAWDSIHTWSGVALIVAAIVHFAIHWRWVTKVTAKVFASLRSQQRISNSGRWMANSGGRERSAL